MRRTLLSSAGYNGPEKESVCAYLFLERDANVTNHGPMETVLRALDAGWAEER